MSEDGLKLDPKVSKVGILEMISILSSGLKLAFSKECRAYVIVPIFINVLILATGSYFVHLYLTELMDAYVQMLPEFFHFLSWVISFLVYAALAVIFCIIFSTVAIFIASPFYGLLSQKVELKLFGTQGNDDGFLDVLKDLPRIIIRQIQIVIFVIPRFLLCLILFIIPGINVIAPAVMFLFVAVTMVIQFTDFAFDNHKIPFKEMKKALQEQPVISLLFGSAVGLGMSVPILNLVVPPAAVCAGTVYFVRLRQVQGLRMGKQE